MEKRSKIEVIDDGFFIPEPIIQHIQSFLTIKEAAETIIISKSWYISWLTRPNLEFDYRDYQNCSFSDHNKFREFVKKTMERYEELNLRIESFKLFINNISLTKELIVKAINMGAVDICFETKLSKFSLPHEVLESVNLLRLSVTKCKIDSKFSVRSSLESLSLFKVSISGDIIWDIISSCHSLEKLVLSDCKCVHKNENPGSTMMTTRKLNLNHTPINQYEFRKIKCLFIEKVKISSLFFSDLSSTFPFVKDLAVHHCFGYKDIQICSPSLECISLAHKNKTLRAKFDVPSVRKFSLSCSNVPSLSFTNSLRECTFEISLTWKAYKTSWFTKLNRFLGNLNQSISSLTLTFGTHLSGGLWLAHYFPEDYGLQENGLPKPVVDNLMMEAASQVSPALLDCLFWCFHPKSIFQYWMPMSCTDSTEAKEQNELLNLLCKKLFMQEENAIRCSLHRSSMRVLRDLEQVSVDIFEDSVGEFQPLPWKMLLDASASPEKTRRIRFNLQWGYGASTTK